MGDRVDSIVIGAGVVGLAIARQLAASGREVLVLERNPGIGQETSSRNSEVIHAGLYYPEGSLKARLCVAGKTMLYQYCEARGIEYRRCGKLIVAAGSGQTVALKNLQRQGIVNGVDDLTLLSKSELSDIEPEVRGHAALLSPSTGILDSHSLMLCLQADLESLGGSVVCRTSAAGGMIRRSKLLVDVVSGDTSMTVETSTLVNAAGLGAYEFARRLQGFPQHLVPQIHYAKGNYFSYQGPNPFRRLVYPLPSQGGLGIHATMDLAGQLRFGPDVEWVSQVDYSISSDRARSFQRAIRSYWPGLPDDSLAPAYCGIRPKLCGPGEPAVDFCIQGPSEHGIPGMFQLFGIESPGLTAALAIAEYISHSLK